MGAASAGVRLGGRARPRVAETGLSRILASADAPDAPGRPPTPASRFQRGDWRIGRPGLRPAERDGWHLVARTDYVFAFESLPILGAGRLSAAVGWRESTRRGVYASAQATARAVSARRRPAPRIDRALPRAWGTVRVGVRAEDIGRRRAGPGPGRRRAGLDALPQPAGGPGDGPAGAAAPGDPLGVASPLRAPLGLEATATFSAQTSLFIRYDHALGDRLYDGAIVTQGEPLAPHVLRFGVFWALLN